MRVSFHVLKHLLSNVLARVTTLSIVLYRTGLDLIKGVVRNNIEAGVVEPAMSKVKIIQVCIRVFVLVPEVLFVKTEVLIALLV